MKNIEIVVLSDWKYKDKTKTENAPAKVYTGEGGFCAICAQTCETGWRYIKQQLGEQPLDCVYAFISETVQKDKAKYEQLFAGQRVEYISLAEDGELQGSFKSICDMFVKVTADNSTAEEVCVHVDMTSGPRHAVMLMTALIQMLKYNKYKLGQVIYTNFQKMKVENAADIMDMYDLVSGTQEFLSFGSVDNIRNYFKKNDKTSAELEELLTAMEDLDAAFEVCASYEELQKALGCLADKLSAYELYAASPSMKATKESEKFFSKLLPMLKKEYGAIIPAAGSKIAAPALIDWCLDKNFLQQALTLYTEWVPLYVIEQKIVEVKNLNVIEECKNKVKGMPWKDWSIVLMREYAPLVIDKTHDRAETMDSATFKSLVMDRQYNALDILNKLPLNSTYHRFVEDLMTATRNYRSRYGGSVSSLPEDNPIRAFINKAYTQQATFKGTLAEYINNTVIIKKTCTLDTFVLKIVALTKANDIDVILGIHAAEKPGLPQVSLTDEEKRKQAFEILLGNDDIAINIQPQDFYELVMNYMFCVNNWRNTSNHASGSAGGKEMIREIKGKIKEGLQILQN